MTVERHRVPAPAGIDAEWLTGVLCKGVPDARVTTVRQLARTDGTTTRARLELAYNDHGTAANLPTRLFAKGTPRLAQRVMLGAGGMAGGEARFYARVRPGLGFDIQAPTAYYAAYDPRAWRSLVLLEDVVATRGARFAAPSPATPTLTPAQVEDALGTAATWHGALWEDPRLDTWRWLRTPAAFSRRIDALLRFADRLPAGYARAGAGASDQIPPAVQRRGERDLLEAMRRSMRRLSQGPSTYLHGDLHVANLYATATGRIGVADWQVGLQGGWAFDVAYLIATALTTEDRRAHERDLLAGYLDALGGAAAAANPDGIASDRRPDLAPEAAWRAYRAALFYPLFAWLYTLGASRLQPAFQPRQLSETLVGRIAAAIDDLGSFESVGL